MGHAGHAEEPAGPAAPGADAARLDARIGTFRPDAGGPVLGWIDVAGAGGTEPGAAIPLGELAELRVVPGPAMIRDVDGQLAGTVHVEVADEVRDLPAFVEAAKAAVAGARAGDHPGLAAGLELRWVGQHRLVEQTRRRLSLIVPLTLLLVALLLWLHFRSLAEVLIVLLSIPFALVGSVWLMWLLDERVSTASWVGLVALVGLAAQTGVVMIVYIDAAYERRRAAGLIRHREDIVAAHLEGTVQRVRPKLMTVATMLAGLAPLLWASGAGAEVLRRLAVPMVGGLLTSAVLTLEIIPVVYTEWRVEQLLHARLAALDPALQRRLRRWAGGLLASVTLLLAAGAVGLAWPPAAAAAGRVGALAGLGAAAALTGWLLLRRTAQGRVWPGPADHWPICPIGHPSAELNDSTIVEGNAASPQRGRGPIGQQS
jgi:hypothetical protein